MPGSIALIPIKKVEVMEKVKIPQGFYKHLKPNLVKISPNTPCYNCTVSLRSEMTNTDYGMDSPHYVQVYLKCLMCAHCNFTTFNIDSLIRHEKQCLKCVNVK